MSNARKRPAMRNPVARSPLLNKGGIHGRTTKAQRKADKQALRAGRDLPARSVFGAVPAHIGP